MARIRSIHPGLFTDEAFVSCPPLARLLLLGIWTDADDYGLFEWKPVPLKMKYLGADMADVPALLGDLVAFDIVKQVTLDGRSYGLVRNFCRWQRPKRPTFRIPLPAEYRSYVGLDAAGKHPDHSRNPHTSPTPPPHVPTKPGKVAQMEEGGGRRKDVGDSKNHIDKPVVVVVPREPEKPAGTTTTTQDENALALQAEPAAKLVNPLGSVLSGDWIPDEACIAVAHDHGMTDADVESEVLRFHALNAQRGTFSQNWNSTWTLWCAEFKRRKAKAPAKAPPRIETSKADPNYTPTERDWDFAAKLFAQAGRWNVLALGPEPTSPACRCPPDVLAKYIVNHAAVPVLAARAKVSA